MNIRFLGTGTSQGIPVIGCDCPACLSTDSRDKRLRVSILVQTKGKNLVIDAGPDFRQQMLAAQITQLDGILITHEHNDHIAGLDDVRPFNFRQDKDMPIYATQSVQKDLRQRFAYVFQENPYPGAPRLTFYTIRKGQTFYIDDIKIEPIETMHGQLPVLGFRFGDFCYITDAKTFEEKELDKIKGTKILVLNALHRKEHHSHLNFQEALNLISILKPQKAYLTHMSHKMGPIATVEKDLPSNVFFAYDGLEIQI